MVEFNRENFRKFILDFDPIDYKYGKWDKEKGKYVWPDEARSQGDAVSTDEDDNKAEAEYYNLINEPTHIEPRDAATMIISTEMAYGSLDKAMLYQDIFQKTLDKILIEYVSIPGLSALFNEHYPEFEWSMHVNMKFKDQRNSYYRDHFIHQIRNMYMMFSMLNDEYIYKNAVDSFTNPSVCRLTEYVSHCMLQYREVYTRAFSNQQHIIEEFNRYKENEKNCSFEQGSDCYFIRYVLYAASAIAALFHDIGYPISYFYEIEDRAVEFIPAFTALLNEGDVNFNHVKDVLGDSLLFQIVNPKQIEEGFLKRDHGVLSALLLALNFYKNGRIYSFSLEKQVALEIGILMIYNHTLDFLYLDEKSKSPLYKLQFARDPLSWLFRFCDDAQEWDREYFEISSSPNLLFCPTCHTPLIKSTDRTYNYRDAFKAVSKYIDKAVSKYIDEEDDNSSEWTELTNIAHYKCRCLPKDKAGANSSMNVNDKSNIEWERFRWFERRQIITVNVCDSVAIKEEFPEIEGSAEKKELGYLLVDFHYDPYKQLRLCTIHHKFSEYRAKDLRKVKKFLQLQSFLVDGKGYKRIVLEHNLSPNPFLLKAMIWGEYFRITQSKFDAMLKQTGEIDEAYKKTINDEIEKVVKGRYSTPEKLQSNIIYNSVFYAYLFIYWMKAMNEHTAMIRYDAVGKAKEEASAYKLDDIEVSEFDVAKFLEELTLKQINNKYRFDADGRVCNDEDDTTNGGKKTDKYMEYLIEEDHVYPLIQQYCDKDAPINQPNVYARDYYSDLFLYEWLSLKTKQEKIKKNKKQNNGQTTGKTN